jgi:hypothetical protein
MSAAVAVSLDRFVELSAWMRAAECGNFALPPDVLVIVRKAEHLASLRAEHVHPHGQRGRAP